MRELRLPVLVLAAGLFAAGCASAAPTPATPSFSPVQLTPGPAAPAPVASARLTGLADPATKLRAARVISTFENSTTDIQYDYAEDLDDGRGVTAGRAGFTSGTGDLLEVVQLYAAQRPDTALARYLPALRAVNGSESTDGLDGLVATWKQTADSDPLLNRIQDQVSDTLYFTPAMAQARRLDVHSALGQLILWDTYVQHGGGTPEEDPDGMPAIAAAVQARRGTAAGDEAAWLRAFLVERRAHLVNPADPDTREAWRESVGRVDALASMLDAGNLDLRPPLAWNVYGDHFALRS